MYAIDNAILIGSLAAAGIYLVLQWSYLRVLIGFIVLSNMALLIILSSGGIATEKAPPIIVEGQESFVDPLPHALILTAIVINFGFTAYLLVLLYRLYVDGGHSNLKTLFSDPDDGESER